MLRLRMSSSHASMMFHKAQYWRRMAVVAHAPLHWALVGCSFAWRPVTAGSAGV